MWDFIGKAVIALAAVRLSMMNFYTQKWWEKKAELYSNMGKSGPATKKTEKVQLPALLGGEDWLPMAVPSRKAGKRRRPGTKAFLEKRAAKFSGK